MYFKFTFCKRKPIVFSIINCKKRYNFLNFFQLGESFQKYRSDSKMQAQIQKDFVIKLLNRFQIFFKQKIDHHFLYNKLQKFDNLLNFFQFGEYFKKHLSDSKMLGLIRKGFVSKLFNEFKIFFLQKKQHSFLYKTLQKTQQFSTFFLFGERLKKYLFDSNMHALIQKGFARNYLKEFV